MYKNKTYLAIVPARSGSKRIKNKNILNLNGKPLIEYTINAGSNSKYIDRVIVSSDSKKILTIAHKIGAETILRPYDLSSDTASPSAVVKHVLETVSNYDYIVLLQPTSPLRNSEHIDEAIETLEEKKADAVISVCKTDHNIMWKNTLPNNKNMRNFLIDGAEKRSQELENYYRINGAIYICKADRMIQENSFFIKDHLYAYEMSRDKSVDIDEPLDFKWAEFLMLNSKC
jgi:CMP-N,N'-diacetyllegionaminic acid synthase